MQTGSWEISFNHILFMVLFYELNFIFVVQCALLGVMSENKMNRYIKYCMYVKYVKDFMTITFVIFISNLHLITILLKEILSYL